MKKSVDKIIKIEYRCKECDTQLIFNIDEFKTAPIGCSVCGASFRHQSKSDPIVSLSSALKELKLTTNAEICLVCEDEL